LKTSGHQYVYHGTTANHAENIKKKGIGKHGISFTGSPIEGRGYAHDRAADTKKDDGVLLRVHKKHLKGGSFHENDNHDPNNAIYKGSIPAHAFEVVGRVTRSKWYKE